MRVWIRVVLSAVFCLYGDDVWILSSKDFKTFLCDAVKAHRIYSRDGGISDFYMRGTTTVILEIRV